MSLAWAPDGSMLASSSGRDKDGKVPVVVCEMLSSRVLCSLKVSGLLNTCAHSRRWTRALAAGLCVCVRACVCVRPAG